MAALRVILCLLALTSTRAVAETTAHDVEYSHHITFEVKGNAKDGYELKSFVEVNQTYLSKRSADSSEIFIYEEPYVRISDIKAKLDDKKISGKYIYTMHVASKDVFLSDDNAWIINLPRKPQPGQALHYSYKEKYVDVAYLPLILIPNIDYITDYVVAVKHPEDISVDFDFFFPTERLAYRIDSTDEKETHLIFDPVYGVKHLPYFPYNRFRAVVMVSLIQHSVAVNPTPLPDFVHWYSERMPKIHPDLAEQKSLLLDGRLDNVSGVWQKLDIINDFVRENIRYISDCRYPNGLIPHEPLQVLNRRYGDCKDRAYLVKALAGLAGINVNMATISTKPKPVFHGVHWSLYNHVICVYSDGDSSLFFDPTAKFCELGDIPEYLIQQPALVLDSLDPRMLTVPVADTSPAIAVTIEAEADSLNSARATVVLRKEYLTWARHAMNDLSPEECERYFGNRFNAAFYKVSLDQFELASEDKHSATFSAHADLSDFVIETDTKIYAPRCAFAGVDHDILERKDDTLPLYFERTSHATLDILLRQVNPPPDRDSTILDGSGTGAFSAVACPADSGSIKLSYEFQCPGKILHGEDKVNFIRFVEEYLNTKNNMFIFDGRTP